MRLSESNSGKELEFDSLEAGVSVGDTIVVNGEEHKITAVNHTGTGLDFRTSVQIEVPVDSIEVKISVKEFMQVEKDMGDGSVEMMWEEVFGDSNV